jgi:V/A-type H+-transporting ATPase subunit G/H
MPAEPERRTAGRHGFTIVLRGYRPTEVDDVLAELQAQSASLAADRDALSGQKAQLASRLLVAIRRIDELDTQVKHLSASAGSADGLSERIRVILELASAEANTMTAQARELLEQTKTTQTNLDHQRAQLGVERTQVLAAARAEADELRQQARQAATANRAETQAAAERILGDARTAATAVVDQAHRTAAADADRLRERLLAELPPTLNTIIDTAIGQLAAPAEVTSRTGDLTGTVAVPQQREPHHETMADDAR